MSAEAHTIPDDIRCKARAYVGHQHRWIGPDEVTSLIAKAINDAVMAERERCAAVVESFAPGGWNYEYGHDDASMRVATRGAILADPKSEG